MSMNRIISLLFALLALLLVLAILMLGEVKAEPPKSRAKFYDFSEQVIDGQIKRPTALYTDSRQKVKFSRLLKLKKSFIPQMLETAKEQVFK